MDIMTKEVTNRFCPL